MIDAKLKTFLTLLEEKSYTKTAKILNFSQPAITLQIKAIEKEYDITLFNNPKTFELSKEGKIMYEYAKEAVLHDELLINTLSRRNTQEMLSIGITENASFLLSHKLYVFLRENMAMNNLYTHSHTSIEQKVANGELDFAIIDNSFDSSVFDSEYIRSENIILVTDAYSQKYQKDRITREMLQTANIVIQNKDSGVYKTVMSFLSNKNIKLKRSTILESNNLDIMINQLISCDGICFLYESIADTFIKKGLVKKVELLNFDCKQNFYLIKNRLNILDEYGQTLYEKLKELGDY